MDYGRHLHALLGHCVDTQLMAVGGRAIYQGEYHINVADPVISLTIAANDILREMRRLGLTRVNLIVRTTRQGLDVNCLFA